MKISLKSVFIALFLFFICSGGVYAQFYTLGNNPASTRWRSISSDNYRIIYPEEVDSLARVYLAKMEYSRSSVMSSLGIATKRISVVLHPYSSMSNGMVAWAPKRVELFTIPPASGYSQEWSSQLVLHESRHIGQMEHFTRGIVKPFSWLLGEQAPGLAVGLLASTWNFEGDAVMTETVLSRSGRGREASFLQYYRMAALTGDMRNWDRWRLGSHYRYTPDIYAFGYMINSASRLYSGDRAYISRLLPGFLKNWYYLWNYEKKTYEKVVGADMYRLFDYSQETMTLLWQHDYDRRKPYSSPVIAASAEKRHTDYVSPVVDGEGHVYALRSGMESVPCLVRCSSSGDDSAEEMLRPMNAYVERIVFSNGKIYWAERVPDIRWGNVNTSDIFYYDIASGRTVRLTHGRYFYNPSPSADGKGVFAVSYHTDGRTSVVHVDGFTGKVREVAPPHGAVQFKDVTACGTDLYFSAIGVSGCGIYRWKNVFPDRYGRFLLEDAEVLAAPADYKIENLFMWKGFLCFNSDADGVDNIFAMDTDGTGEIRRLVNSEFGAVNPFVTGSDVLYYSNLTPGGYRVAYIDAFPGKEVSMNFKGAYPLADYLAEGSRPVDFSSQEFDGLFSVIDTLPSKRYRGVANLFRFHSWAPVYYNVDKIKSLSMETLYEAVSPGVVFFSQNTLSTAETMAGYSYHGGFHSGHVKFSYTGWYPVIELSADFNDRYRYSVSGNGYAEDRVPYLNVKFNAYVPLNFSSGGLNRGLVPQVSFNYTNDRYLGSEGYDSYYNVMAGIRYYSMYPVADAGIYPKKGFSVSAYYFSHPSDKGNLGDIAWLYSYGYLPGFGKNHGIRLSASFQKQFMYGKKYYQSGFASMPRGCTLRFADYTAGCTFDYAMPFYLGDVSWGKFAYWKRLQVIPFADYTYVNSRFSGNEHLWSAGSDILVDANFLHISWPVSVGFRYSYSCDSPFNMSLLFSVSIP